MPNKRKIKTFDKIDMIGKPMVSLFFYAQIHKINHYNEQFLQKKH